MTAKVRNFLQDIHAGFRMGWVLAHPMVIDSFVKAKQSTDLCTSAFLQKVTVKLLKNYFDARRKSLICVS